MTSSSTASPTGATPGPVAKGRRRFRPTFWGGLVAGGAILFMAGLGTWQVQRLFWKQGILDHIQQQMAAAPAELPAKIDDPKAWDYRRVRITGHFLNNHELYLGARSLKGAPGYDVVTPFVRADGGGVVLVDRGWVPTQGKDPARRPEGQLEGEVTVDGVARVPPPRGWMQPDNLVNDNFWLWYDLPAMAAKAGTEVPEPVVVEAGATSNPGGFPVGGQTRVTIPNDHLQYAITWYCLAVALAVIAYLRFSRVETET
ncbi:SURF1 family protein [Nitrospirillum viridazoti Y2]|uniref:SURF1-like protein n=1 Tax=Nitrospirillum amazonense TaxID=28077 RepID=A0A560ISP0_9PROT|nr:SURF1 family protein [Nitrospirillum amazonense]EGY01628.1 SURF1 family protein [Nitrospirillum amazonense Y2]TWB62073.1 surfeit locus 1 family protein [Nitrospirillum amazonense]